MKDGFIPGCRWAAQMHRPVSAFTVAIGGKADMLFCGAHFCL